MSDYDREWYPCDYIDEILPTHRSSPDAWLVRCGGGWTIDHPYDSAEEAAEHEWTGGRPISPGEKVEFCYCDRLLDFEMTVRKNGDFEIHGAVDPKANNFYCYGWGPEGPQGDDIKDFAEQYASDYLNGDSERVKVGCCYWEWNLTYALVVDGDKATLTPAGNA